jgi:uncharacterized protein
VEYRSKGSEVMLRVGLISDTHGLLRPEALAFLKGSEFIIHGGDIGEASILETLSEIAPVTAVRGNNDRGRWVERIGETELLQAGEAFIYAIHDLARIGIDPKSAGVQAIVSGHSHIPSIEWREGVLYVNPGSSGPRRFRLPISVGEIIVSGRTVSARIVELP